MERKDYDFYPTPEDTVKQLLLNLDLSKYGNLVLEPSAGSGNVCRVMKRFHPEKKIVSVEIRESERSLLEKTSDKVLIGNFLGFNPKFKFDIIIGNPPFNQSMEFVKKSLELLSDKGILIFLMRTSMLEGKARCDFWEEFPLSKLYVLSSRPSFVGGGTDSTSYSWFIWDKTTSNQEIKVI